MERFIPLSVPNLRGNELKYVTEAIEQEWVSTGGAFINKFEKDLAKYVKVESAIACQSGTAGLHLSLILSGIGNGDEVIVPTLTFIAAVNPVKYVGAEPIFMDCDDSLTIDIKKLKEFCNSECIFREGKLINKNTNKHIKAIIVVHVFGNIADMEELVKLCKKYNLKLIEDATEALGSKILSGQFKDKYAGTIGDFGVYSFNGNKIITTGGGGMLIAKDEELAEKAKYLSTQAKDDQINYIHNEIGYNYRMTNLQAALGVAQLEKLEEFIEIKKRNYSYYYNEIEKVQGLNLLKFKENIRSNYWFYSLVIDNEYGINKDELIKVLSEQGIQSRPIWGLIHEQKPYIANQAYKIEKAKYYVEHIINIPCSSNLTINDIKYIIDILSRK